MKANGANITVLALSVLFSLQSTASALATTCALKRHVGYEGGYPIIGPSTHTQNTFQKEFFIGWPGPGTQESEIGRGVFNYERAGTTETMRFKNLTMQDSAEAIIDHTAGTSASAILPYSPSLMTNGKTQMDRLSAQCRPVDINRLVLLRLSRCEFEVADGQKLVLTGSEKSLWIKESGTEVLREFMFYNTQGSCGFTTYSPPMNIAQENLPGFDLVLYANRPTYGSVKASFKTSSFPTIKLKGFTK